MCFSAWNGLGLALVIPCVQSLIADVYSNSTRGRAFGLLFFTSGLGACSPTYKPTCPLLAVTTMSIWNYLGHLIKIHSICCFKYWASVCYQKELLLRVMGHNSQTYELRVPYCRLEGKSRGFHACAGGMAGGFFATSIGSQKPFGVDGWRFAFFTIAGVSIGTAFLTLLLASDPRKVCLQ